MFDPLYFATLRATLWIWRVILVWLGLTTLGFIVDAWLDVRRQDKERKQWRR